MAPDLHAPASGPAGAPVVILLHPMGHSAAIWNPHRALLSERFRVIAPDLPGHGKSGGPFTVAASVEGLSRLIAEVAPGAPVHLAGLSLGARIALRYAVGHPVASLALFGCGISPVSNGRRFIARLLPAGVFPADVGKQTVLASMAQVAKLDLRPDLAKVTVPALVVVGEKDRPYLAAAREIADGISGAELRTIPGAGHLWPQDRVDEFVAVLTEWVPKTPAR